MKIQLLSDTHHSPYFLDENADLIIHCGDFGNGLAGAIDFHRRCKALGKPYVFVLGNHDFYHSNIQETYDEIKRLKLNCLFENEIFEFSGWTFVGGTLFSNFRQNTATPLEHEQYKAVANNGVADFQLIYDYSANGKGERIVKAADYIAFFERQLAWINQFLGKPKTVVITHFPPSTACQDPQFTGSLLNPYFINDIDVSGFNYWFSGHTHSAFNLLHQGCQLVINPLGYPHEQGRNGFIPDLLIELPD